MRVDGGAPVTHQERTGATKAIEVCECRCVCEIDLAASKLFGECVTVCHSII